MVAEGMGEGRGMTGTKDGKCVIRGLSWVRASDAGGMGEGRGVTRLQKAWVRPGV
jgi:hypothetical protein